jgi:hypothetical protein
MIKILFSVVFVLYDALVLLPLLLLSILAEVIMQIINKGNLMKYLVSVKESITNIVREQVEDVREI